MDKGILPEPSLWIKFQKAAKKRRQDPIRLLTDYVRELLEAWEDQELDEEIRRDVRRSGYREKESVDIVRRYRSEKARLQIAGGD